MSLTAALSVDHLLPVTVSREGSSVRVMAAGEVDSYSAPHLAAAIEAATNATPYGVIVDLNRVTFLDSAGVHVLAAAYRRAAAVGAQLHVVASRRAVQRPLQISGLWPLLTAGAGASA